MNHITLCGLSRSKCGYCQGSRTNILSTPNPAFPKMTGDKNNDYTPQPKIIHPISTAGMNSGTSSSSASSSSSSSYNNNKNGKELVTPATSSKAYSILASSIESMDYQILLDRGWRRSGELFYLPKNWECCCPSHPIRLDVNKFIPGKGQKKVLRNLNAILHTRGATESKRSTNSNSNSDSNNRQGHNITTQDNLNVINNRHQQNEIYLKKHSAKNDSNLKQDVGAGGGPVLGLGLGRKRTRKNARLGNNANNKGEVHNNYDGTPSHEQIQKHARSLITKSNLLTLLKSKTQQIVTNYIQEHRNQPQQQHRNHVIQPQHHSNGWNANDSTSSKSTFNNDTFRDGDIENYTRYKVMKMDKPVTKQQLQQQQQQQQQQHKNSKTITSIQNQKNQISWPMQVKATLSSTVCPALHGKSRGFIDKKSLAKIIVDRLQIDTDVQQFNWNYDNDTIHDNCHQSVKLNSVSYHEKSCQMNIEITVHVMMTMMVVDNNNDEQQLSSANVAGTTATGIGASNPTPSSNIMAKNAEQNKKRIENAISNFIQSTCESSCEYRTRDITKGLQPPYKLTVRSIPSSVSGRDPKVFRLYTKYQSAIHNDPDPFIHKEEQQNVKINDVEWDPMDDTEHDDDSMVDESEHNDVIGKYKQSGKLSIDDFEALYKRKYNDAQRQKIYKSYTDYYRFLCASPVRKGNSNTAQLRQSTTTQTQNGSEKSSLKNIFMFDIDEEDTKIPCGSYHQHYLINDKYLIAVGVVDVLPKCISSVYAFYDPILSRELNLGKLTALYEIDWLKHAQLHRPDLKYYYLGYYIHSCQKMRYKAEYKPSDILCPVNRKWTDFEDVKNRLELLSPVRHCCEFFTSGGSNIDEDYNVMQEDESLNMNVATNNGSVGWVVEQKDVLDSIQLNIAPNSIYITLSMLTDEGQNIVRPVLKEFVKETGAEVAKRCVIKLY